MLGNMFDPKDLRFRKKKKKMINYIKVEGEMSYVFML